MSPSKRPWRMWMPKHWMPLICSDAAGRLGSRRRVRSAAPATARTRAHAVFATPGSALDLLARLQRVSDFARHKAATVASGQPLDNYTGAVSGAAGSSELHGTVPVGGDNDDAAETAPPCAPAEPDDEVDGVVLPSFQAAVTSMAADELDDDVDGVPLAGSTGAARGHSAASAHELQGTLVLAAAAVQADEDVDGVPIFGAACTRMHARPVCRPQACLSLAGGDEDVDGVPLR